MSDVTLAIDGKEVTVPQGTTIWDAAKVQGVDIPVLCHDPRLDPVGVCRMCVVDVGGRVLAASCVRPCENGMEVKTHTEQVEKQRRMLTELLMALEEEFNVDIDDEANTIETVADAVNYIKSKVNGT